MATINDDNRVVDENEFIYSLPITIPIILFLMFIANKLDYYNKSKKLNRQLTQEIDELFSELSSFKKDNYIKAKTAYKNLLHEKAALSKETYLQKLIAIRDGLTPRIKNNP